MKLPEKSACFVLYRILASAALALAAGCGAAAAAGPDTAEAKGKAILFAQPAQSPDFATKVITDPLYGPRYAQVVVRREKLRAVSDGPFSCDKHTTLGQFFKLLGIKTNGKASIVVSLRDSRNPNEYLIQNMPIYAVEKRGNECIDTYVNTPITPLIKPTSNDYFLLDFEILHKKEDKSDFSPILNIVKDIATIASQDLTDGLVSDVTEVATSGLNHRIQDLMSNMRDRTGKINASVELTLSQNTRGFNNDRYIFSVISPQGVGAGMTFDPERSNVTPIVLEVAFTPSLFAGCATHILLPETADPAQSPGCSFDNYEDVIAKKLNNKRLVDVTEQSEGIATRLNALNAKIAKGVDVRNELRDICIDIKTGEKYLPASALNTVDNVILRYSVLTKYVDYRNNPDIRHQQCISDAERRLIGGLSPTLYRLVGDRPTKEEVQDRAKELNRDLRLRDPERNRVLFSADGQVAFLLKPLLKGGRKRYYEVKNGGAKALASFDAYVGAPWCTEYATSGDGSKALSPYGFYQTIIDDGVEQAVGVYVEYSEEDPVKIRDIEFTTPYDLYTRLGRRGTAAGSVVTGPNSVCSTPHQKQLFKKLDELSATEETG